MSASIKQDFKSMGKEELRAACRAVGIKYGKMNNDQMRAELAKFSNDKPPNPKLETKTKLVKTAAKLKSSPFDSLMGIQKVPESFNTTPSKIIRDGKQVGYTNNAGVKVNLNKKTEAPRLPRQQQKGYKIEKARDEQNGVKRRSSGTVCGKIWDYFDSNPGIRACDLINVADNNNWNRANVSCEFYAWRKFHGVRGRQ